MTRSHPGPPRKFRQPTPAEDIKLRDVVAALRRRRDRPPHGLARESARSSDHDSTTQIPRHAYRWEIVLAASGGMSNRSIARRFHLRPASVGALLNRFSDRGIDALYDHHRTGRPSGLPNELVQEVLGLHRESHLTQGEIAGIVGVTRFQVWNILKKARRRQRSPRVSIS